MGPTPAAIADPAQEQASEVQSATRGMQADFIAEAEHALHQIRGNSDAVCETGDSPRLGLLFRNVHTYKSLMAFARMPVQSAFAAELEQYLAALWHGRIPLDDVARDLVLRACAHLRALHRAGPILGAGAPDSVTSKLQAALACVESQPLLRSPDSGAPLQPLPSALTLGRSAHVGYDELSDLESQALNLSRLLGHLEQALPESGDERAEALLEALRRGTEKIRQTVRRQRYLSLRSFFLPMISTVQDMATYHQRQAVVRLEVDSREVDRSVLESLRPSLVHLLRNAVAHGIETPAVRQAAGKPPVGTITMESHWRDGYLEVSVSDDGKGFDIGALKAAAVEAGAVSPEKADLTSDQEARLLAFIPGLSTSPVVDDLSGNGVGLTVVAEDVAGLGGTVGITSESGKFTTITLSVPIA